MRILALDSSTGPASIALWQDGHCIAAHEDAEAMRQSQRLVSAVDTLVRAHGGYGTITGMAATIGPGGFTGIRIALAAARGLALACDVPLLGISTLHTFGWQALHDQPQGAQTVVFVNAYRNQAYAQAFMRTDHAMQPLCPAEAVDNTALAAFTTAFPEARALGNVPAETVQSDRYSAYNAPHARYAAGYAAMLLQQDAATAIKEHPAEAFYIRPPDAKPQKAFLRP